jgi:hypothetical protein
LAKEPTPTQKAFITCRDAFPAFVGGFGSGKTAAAIARAVRLKRLCPKQDVAYYLPTYGLIEDIAFQRFPALFQRMGWRYKLNEKKKRLYCDLGSFVFRSMDDPGTIIGYQVAHSIVDELDTMPVDKARNAWNKIIARNRQMAATASGMEIPNTVAVATTPEGFRFVYDRWVRKGGPGYRLFHASTMENAANLPTGYIDNLRNTYTPALLAAYLDGQFVNLTSGSVYVAFDRKANACDTRINGGETLHIGMDFNVANMAAVTFVLRGDDPHAVDELVGIYDTPGMISAIRSRYAGHRVMVYPDASGQSRRSNNASESDVALLRQAGFTVIVNPANPAVKDRVLAKNKMLETRRMRVNPERCPHYVEALEQQCYDKAGEPDKAAGFDHVNDAGGYFIAHRYPIKRPLLSGAVTFN